jgi:hypothetical protein
MELSELKSKWIGMRNNKIPLDIQFIYEYAIHKGMKVTPEIISVVAQFYPADLMTEHFDREFDLTRVYDKNNNFIKIVE